MEHEESQQVFNYVRAVREDNVAEKQFRHVTRERRDICQLRNDYVDLMKPVWDSFSRKVKVRVDLEVDSKGEVVFDDEGRPNDLSGNKPFDTKSA